MKITTAIAGLSLLTLPSLTAFADDDTQWQKNHPRREQVNERLNNQRKRINEGEKSGKLTPQQAGELHKEDRNIRQQERQMARQNGGHITKTEQRALNQEENRSSRKIYREKHAK